MLWEAKKYGARVALYGRKINHAEDQLGFIDYLRPWPRPDSVRRRPWGVPRRLAAAGHPAPAPGRRSPADRNGVELQRFPSPPVKPVGSAPGSGRKPRLQQNEAGGKGPLESGRWKRIVGRWWRVVGSG